MNPTNPANRYAALDAFVDAHFDEQVRFLQELVRVPTDTPPGNNAPHAQRTRELLSAWDMPAQAHAVPDALVQAQGWRFINADLTVLAQVPRVGPHRLLMRRVTELAALEGLTRFDVGVGCDPGSDALWPEARAFADFAIPIGGPARRALFARAVRSQGL